MKGKNGFTMIEMMTAVTLSGIVLMIALPLLLTGTGISSRFMRREALVTAGDGIFEYAAREMKLAGRIWIGDADEGRPEATGEWKELSLPHRRELLGDADLVMEVNAVGRDRLRLTVRLLENGRTIYERTEVISLLNISLGEPGRIEGCTDKSRTTMPKDRAEAALVLWYQSVGNAR